MDNKGKQATSKERFDQLVEDSLRELRSISGEDLINMVLVLDIQLKKLIDVQVMPPVLIIGALMNQVSRLSSGGNAMAIKHALEEYNKFIFATFVTKKEFNILMSQIEEIKKMLEAETSFNAKIE